MGLTEEEARFVSELRDLFERSQARAERLDACHADLKERGQLNRYVLHRYQCPRGCQVAVIFRFGGFPLCAVRDYKYSPGLNAERSVPSARQRNTIDGNRHWPSHVYDLEELANFSPQAGLTMACRHISKVELATSALLAIQGVRPGRPGRPTILSTDVDDPQSR